MGAPACSASTPSTPTGIPTACRTKLEERDPSGTTVNRRYTVSWSLEPPTDDELHQDYHVEDIKAGSASGTINNPGWYFVLLDTFTVKLQVQQGDARDLEREEVLALLDDFNFCWNYDGMPSADSGSDSLADMIRNHEVEADYNETTHEIIISGSWRYSVNNNPIVYYLVETADDDGGTADGKLSGDELPTSLTGDDAPLEADDWYNILYDNTGVPNADNITTQVYSGGTLRLVRGGDTEYTATKVWKDAYEQNDEHAQRPDVTFTLYRYLRTSGVNSASKYTGETGAPVDVDLVWVEGDEDDPEGHWEVQVLDSADQLANLPQYDSQSGREWIYVVKETLSGGQYEQVFGEVEWDGARWNKEIDDLEEWGLSTESERASGNTYLYNGDTLTNLQTGTISVGATKEWKSATFQSGFDNVVVELTLQYRVEGTDSWEDFENRGKPLVRYLYDFTAVKLTDTLDDLPGLEQYQGGDKTKELEYRWLETAVYGGVVVTEENREKVEEAIAEHNQDPDNSNIRKYEINYQTGENGADTSTSNDPVGTFTVEGTRSYTVSHDLNDGITKITNTVQDTVSYEAIKEWHSGVGEQVTLQIFRGRHRRGVYIRYAVSGVHPERR